MAPWSSFASSANPAELSGWNVGLASGAAPDDLRACNAPSSSKMLWPPCKSRCSRCCCGCCCCRSSRRVRSPVLLAMARHLACEAATGSTKNVALLPLSWPAQCRAKARRPCRSSQSRRPLATLRIWKPPCGCGSNTKLSLARRARRPRLRPWRLQRRPALRPCGPSRRQWTAVEPAAKPGADMVPARAAAPLEVSNVQMRRVLLELRPRVRPRGRRRLMASREAEDGR